MSKKKEFVHLELSSDLLECIKNSDKISCFDDFCIAENTGIFEYFLNAISSRTLDLCRMDLKVIPDAILNKLQPPTASVPSETVTQLTGILLALRNGGTLHTGVKGFCERTQAFSLAIVMERFRRRGILESYNIDDPLDPNTNVKVSFSESIYVKNQRGFVPQLFWTLEVLELNKKVLSGNSFFQTRNSFFQTRTLILRHFKIRSFKQVNSSFQPNNSFFRTSKIRLFGQICLKERISEFVLSNKWYLQVVKNKGFLEGMILAMLKTLKAVVKRFVVTTTSEGRTANAKA